VDNGLQPLVYEFAKAGIKMEIRLRGRLFGRERPSDIVIRNGVIASMEPSGRARADIGSKRSILGPTLFDIQVNGACGIDLQSPSLKPEDVFKITDVLASWGVSCWIPTIITAPADAIEHGCRVIADAMQDPGIARAVPGIHVEGPYISPQDGPRGAHAREYVRNPDLKEFDRLYKAARGNIIYITMAPELDGAVRFIKGVTARGVKVALGHHNGNAEQIARAVDAGARLSTHLGNGLASTINRHLNPLWPQLADDRLTAGLIADLQHLPAPVLKTFVRAKRPENVILTSDCVHIAGLPSGKYKLGGLDVEMLPSGRICLSGTDLLAGSSLMLLQGVINAAETTDLSLEQAFASASTVPAKFFGLKRRFTPPKVGVKADLLLFDIERDAQGKASAVVRSVFINGARRV